MTGYLTLDTLPSPETLATNFTDKAVAFFSGASKLFNHYHRTFRIDSIGFSSVEQFLVYRKAMMKYPSQMAKLEFAWISRNLMNPYNVNYTLPSVAQVLGQMPESKVFAKLNANSGFHQIKLSPDSQLLTTFISPFGHYCYEKLPFRINSAPEHNQKQLQKVVGDLEGVACLMDDIVVYGKTEEHNMHLKKCMQCPSDDGAKPNLSSIRKRSNFLDMS